MHSKKIKFSFLIIAIIFALAAYFLNILSKASDSENKIIDLSSFNGQIYKNLGKPKLPIKYVSFNLDNFSKKAILSFKFDTTRTKNIILEVWEEKSSKLAYANTKKILDWPIFYESGLMYNENKKIIIKPQKKQALIAGPGYLFFFAIVFFIIFLINFFPKIIKKTNAKFFKSPA